MLNLLLPILLASPASAQAVAPDSLRAEIEALPEAEAERLLYVTPSGAPWPSGAVLQWECHRGQLRVYITNRRDETLYLDWSKSHFVDAAGKTWPLRAASQDYPTRDAIEPASPYEESLALVDGPNILYRPVDVGGELEVTLSIGGADDPSPYQERFQIDMNLDQVEHSLVAEDRHLLEFQKKRTVTATVMGVLLAGAGSYLLVDRSLGERNGAVDTELNTTRLALGGGGLGLGAVITLASSIRRASLSKQIEALEPPA